MVAGSGSVITKLTDEQADYTKMYQTQVRLNLRVININLDKHNKYIV
ncbi:MAG: hypothetical protein Ctma_0400 [Catillopecten margaritatus gill symbiont]|uniref:Uncharacterized protein n=1 Tax=Catillopecten margaritatus gill symbiont TaxID=3083288 RepID=A0AAU6PFA8_9GAMM